MTSLVFRIVRSIGVSLRDDEDSEDGECCGEPEDGGDPCELGEPLVGFVELVAQEVGFLLEGVSAAVHLVGVVDELGDGFLVFLAGVLEDADGALNFGLFAFVPGDALHGMGDILSGVVVLFFEAVGPDGKPGAEVTGCVMQLGDGDVDSGDVIDDAFVVVLDGLDCGVAVVAAGGAVALCLGVGGGHGVSSFLVGVGWAVRIVGMDFSTLFSGGSAIAAIVSVFFAIVSWYQSLGSKKAKEKAEEAHKAALEMRDAAVRAAEATEERARQMKQIVAEQQKQSESQGKIESHLWRPAFELTWDSGDTYLLRNVTGESIEVLEVANLAEFFRCDQIQRVFRPGESLRVFMLGVSGMPLPPNLELRISGVDEVVTVPIRR